MFKSKKLIGIGLSLALAGAILWGSGLVLALQMSQTRLTTASEANRGSFRPSVSADGSIVAFESDSDFLGQGLADNQFEIWLYDTATMTFTRVTSVSQANRDSFRPSVSADGSKVAFRSDSDFLGQGIADNQFEIWLYDTATMTFTRVTSASQAGRVNSRPRVSADGSTVAFHSDFDFLGQGTEQFQFEIWLYDTATMALTRITSSSGGGGIRGSGGPRMSADGSTVAFQSDSDFLGQGITDNQNEIWLYDTTTMTFTRVTSASQVNRDNFTPSVSADGSTVAFYSDSDFFGQSIADDQFEIWLYDTATMTLTRLTSSSDGANRASSDPSVSADGSTVAFESDSDFFGQGIADDQNEIWLYDTTTMTLTRITTSSDVTNRDSFDPSVSADGSTVAFHSDSDFFGQGIADGQDEIWLFTLESGSTLYLPILFKDYPQIEPVGTANPAPIAISPVTTVGETFFSADITIPTLQPTGSYHFSSSPDSLANIFVDDIIEIVSEGTVVFSHTFGDPAVLEIPRATMESIEGKAVTLQFRDGFGEQTSATAVYLVYQP